MSLSCSLDAFATSFAFGSQKVKIGFLKNVILSIVASAALALAVLLGGFLQELLPAFVAVIGSFIILSGLGVYKVLASIFEKSGEVKPARPLSFLEATILAVTLSLDGMAAGFGVALTRANPLIIFIASLTVGCFAIFLGNKLGMRLSKKVKMNLSWLSGVLLILIAITNLVL